MRTKEQFKDYVYEKADKKRNADRRSFLALTRGIAAFSLLFFISGVLIYGSFINKNKYAPESLREDGEVNTKKFYYFSQNKGNDDCLETVAEEIARVKCYAVLDTGEAETVVLENSFTDYSVPIVKNFSFEDDIKEYKCETESAVRGGGNVNQERAIEIAKENCTIEYNAIDVFFDSAENIWKIVFFTENTAGGCQTVYVNGDGTLRLIVYGE